VPVAQISRILVVVGTGVRRLQVAVHVSGRLRCSPAAARQLRDVIDKSLEKLEQPQGADVAGKLN
jgi:hypothetical protein